jgi:protein TonB
MSSTAERFRKGKRPERNGVHGTTVLLSLVLHLVGFGAAVGLPRLMPRRPPGDSVYVVDLVSLPPGAPARSQRPSRKAATNLPQAPKPKPKPKKPIKIPERTTPEKPPAEKPKVEKPAPEPIATEPQPTRPETTAAQEAAGTTADPSPTGSAAAAAGGVGVSVGGRGAAGSGASDEYTFYLSLLDRNIRRAWNQPIYTGTELKTATVSLELSRSGGVLHLELLTPSGYVPLDRSVIRAVRDAAPFPPFPHFLGLDTLAVQIVFELDPGGRSADYPGE